MNVHKGMNLVRLWLNDSEESKIISYLEGNYKDELFDLMNEIYKRDKDGFLK